MRRIIPVIIAIFLLLQGIPGVFALQTAPSPETEDQPGQTAAPTETTAPQQTGTQSETQATAPARDADQCGEDVRWSLSKEGILTISGTGPMDDFTAAPWAESREKIRAVSIGDGITYIGAHAFENLDEVKQVVIGSGVKELGTAAFRSCDGLRELSLPKGFKILGEDSLRSCAGLQTIRFEGNMPSFRLNCLWDTTVELIYPAGNPWPLEHIMQLEEAFQGRIEFLSADGTDPYVSAIDEMEATAPTTQPEETEPLEVIIQPTTEPTQPPTEEAAETTEPVTEATEIPTEPETVPPTTEEATEDPVQPSTEPQEEPPRRSEGGGLGFAIIMGALSLVMLGALVFGRRRPGGKYRR